MKTFAASSSSLEPFEDFKFLQPSAMLSNALEIFIDKTDFVYEDGERRLLTKCGSFDENLIAKVDASPANQIERKNFQLSRI